MDTTWRDRCEIHSVSSFNRKIKSPKAFDFRRFGSVV